MHPQNHAILKALVGVAWADGSFGPAEREMLEALLVAFDANEAESDEVRKYAETKRALEDIPIDELSADDLRVLVNHAVVLTFIDGRQDEKEKAFVEQMARYVGIPDDEAKHLISTAEDRARRNLRSL